MKKLVLFTVLGSMLLAGCQRNNISSTDQPTIALVLKTLNNPFFIDMQKGAEDAAKKLGVSWSCKPPSAKSTWKNRCRLSRT